MPLKSLRTSILTFTLCPRLCISAKTAFTLDPSGRTGPVYYSLQSEVKQGKSQHADSCKRSMKQTETGRELKPHTPPPGQATKRSKQYLTEQIKLTAQYFKHFHSVLLNNIPSHPFFFFFFFTHLSSSLLSPAHPSPHSFVLTRMGHKRSSEAV